MPFTLLTPHRRDALLVVLALCLLTAPLWTPALELDDQRHQYERVELSAADGTIELATQDFHFRHEGPISDRIACSGGWNTRPCGLEGFLLEEGPAPSGIYTSNPDWNSGHWGDSYGYVLLNGSVYETTYETNTSAQRSDGLYRVEMDLDRVSPEQALRDVSEPVDASNLPGVVKQAARNGEASTHDGVSAPATPIRTDDGSYYRVYQTESTGPPAGQEALDNVLTFGGPLFGLIGLHSVSRRVDLVYLGDGE